MVITFKIHKMDKMLTLLPRETLKLLRQKRHLKKIHRIILQQTPPRNIESPCPKKPTPTSLMSINPLKSPITPFF
jgi:hypothetical protein